jgi:type I restriction enzyme S subunit
VCDLIATKLKQKNALMQRLFTGKKRLPGFIVAWKEYRLGDLLKARNVKRPIDGSHVLYSLTIENGVTPKTERYDREALVRDKTAKRYKVVQPGDIVYNPANIRWGAIGKSVEDRPVLISPVYEVLYTTDPSRADQDFLFQRLSWERQIRVFASRVEGTLIERMAVKLDAFMLTKITIPSDPSEQRAVSEVLATADADVSSPESKRDAIQRQKAGLMQKLLTGQMRVKV